MKLLVSWLHDFVDVRATVAEIASTLSMCGFEVAAIEEVVEGGAGLQPGDRVIDFEITANRPDCLSVIGLAREAATAFSRPLRLPWNAEGRPISMTGPTPPASAARLAADGFAVTIEDDDLCPRYAAALADVTIGPSPAWLAARLAAAGVRPINNVVDVTNYVLLEMGHPMHAFDRDRLNGGELRARPARAGETIVTLDGEERKLEAGTLVIADARSPQAVAGVMGGAASEVWAGTRRIVLESAYFKPASVRRTSKRLSLKTEASSRFERGADISAPVAALERACALIEQIGCGRRAGDLIDCYPAPRGPVTVGLRRSRIARLLGTTVSDAEVTRIFGGLGFAAVEAPDGWTVTVPTHRVDISREADLIEEVARHHGYDKVPTTFPPQLDVPPRPDPRLARKALLRHVLTAAGFSEAIGFTFIEAAAARPFADSRPTAETGAAPAVVGVPAGRPAAAAAPEQDARLIPIAYPLSEKFAVLRPSLLPGLVDAVAHNRRRESADVRLFEIGDAFSPDRGEQARLGFAWAGAGSPEHWGGGHRPVDFFDAKGLVERILEAVRLTAGFAPAARPWLVAGRTAAVSVDGAEIGVFGALDPAIARAREMPGSDDVYVAEFDLDAIDRLVRLEDVQFRQLPRYPSVVRDLSILVDEGLPSKRVRETIQAAAPATLVHVQEFDRYKGKNIPEGRYSLSLRLTFRSPERTLVDAEVQQAMERVLEALVREHRAVQR